MKIDVCKKIFDDCYKQKRFDDYDDWITAGMAIKNTFNKDDALELFNYYSTKGSSTPKLLYSYHGGWPDPMYSIVNLCSPPTNTNQ